LPAWRKPFTIGPGRMTEFKAKYEVTQQLQDDSVKQFFWNLLLRPLRITRLCLVLFILLGFLFFDLPYKQWLVGFIGGLLLFLVIAWAKSYFNMIKHARKGLEMMDSPQVEIWLNESLIQYTSSTGTRRHQWDKVERIEATKDFLILMNGKLPLLSIPKSRLSGEALHFMMERVQPEIRDGAIE